MELLNLMGKMRLSLKLWLMFGMVWFGTKFLDYLFASSDPIFNLGLAITAMMILAANHFEKQR